MWNFKPTDRVVSPEDPLVEGGWIHPGGNYGPLRVWSVGPVWAEVAGLGGKYVALHIKDVCRMGSWRHLEAWEGREQCQK